METICVKCNILFNTEEHYLYHKGKTHDEIEQMNDHIGLQNNQISNLQGRLAEAEAEIRSLERQREHLEEIIANRV